MSHATWEELLQAFQQAAHEFANGNPAPVERLFSRRDDVVLANPFGSAVRGRERVEQALAAASGTMSGGRPPEFERIASYQSGDLAVAVELERWQTAIGEGEPTPFTLRVTSVLRREEDGWRIGHRHADPIQTYDVRGPLRAR